MLCMVTGEDEKACYAMAKGAIDDGSALNKLCEMISAQGGNAGVVDDFSLFKQPKHTVEISSEREGYIEHTDAEKIGLASVILGAGREKKGDPIRLERRNSPQKRKQGIVLKREIRWRYFTPTMKVKSKKRSENFLMLSPSAIKSRLHKSIYIE